MRGVAGESWDVPEQFAVLLHPAKDALLKGNGGCYFEATGKALEENIATFRDCRSARTPWLVVPVICWLDYGGELTDMWIAPLASLFAISTQACGCSEDACCWPIIEA